MEAALTIRGILFLAAAGLVIGVISVTLILAAINAVHSQFKTIAMNQEQLAAQLKDVATQLGKAKAEIIDKVASLEEAIVNAGNASPEVEQALAELKGVTQALDDLNTDIVPEPQTPETPETTE